MDCRCLLLLFAAASLLVSGSSAIPYRKAYRTSAVDDNLLKALLRVQELEEEKAAEEEAEEAVAETITKLLDEEEAGREEEALAEEEAAERAEDGRFNPPTYDFEYPEYEDAEEIPSNDINGELYEPLRADTRSLELPYNSYPRQQYDEVDRRGDDQYDLDKLYPDLPDPDDPEPKISEPDDALSPEEYAALLDYLGLQEDTRRSDGYYDGEEVDTLDDYDPRKTAKRTRDHNAYHRAYKMFWSNLGKPREERRWEDSKDDMEEQDDWNESGAYRAQDLGADKKALERPGDQGRVSWRHPGNDMAAGYEPYQREKYPSPLEDMMETYEPEDAPYEDEERYQERSSQPEWANTDRDDQQDDDYESFLIRNERNDKLLDALYEDQIPANAVDPADTEEEEDEEDFDKYEKMAEALLREYPELASAAEKVLDELIDEEDAEDAERREDGIFGDGGEAEEPTFEEEPQKIEDRADKNPLEGYTHNNIDLIQRKRLFQDEEEEEEEGEGGGDKDDDEKPPVSYYDILKQDDERPNDEEENNDAEDPYSLDDAYDADDEKKADVAEDYPDDYPDIPAETPEDEPRSPEAEDLGLDEDRVEAFLDRVEDLLKATEAVSPPLCPVNVSDCHLIEDGSPLSSGPYKEYFTAVCNRHEACYQCGSAHGISSSTCDRAMKYDLAEVCDMLAEVEGQDVDDMCKMKGEALHLAARLKRAYQETAVPECSYKCVVEFIVGS